MGEILDLAERAWQGDLAKQRIHPGQALVGFEEIADNIGFMSAFSNVGVLRTEEGLAFLDTSSFFHAEALHTAIREWSPDPAFGRCETGSHLLFPVFFCGATH